ncbi:MAG: hypothetical protein K2H49_04810 [Muribaculaceae bacterium]|nr:hypothetical protein [Muribaculaceae bacterium]
MEDAKAPRNEDGSLPDNGFCRLIEGSILTDKGEIVKDFRPARFMTADQAAQYNLEIAEAAPVTIAYNGAAPDLGPFESDYEAGVEEIASTVSNTPDYFITRTAIVIDNPVNVAYAALYSLDGSILTESTRSSIISIPKKHSGIVILYVKDNNGFSYSAKITLKN